MPHHPQTFPPLPTFHSWHRRLLSSSFPSHNSASSKFSHPSCHGLGVGENQTLTLIFFILHSLSDITHSQQLQQSLKMPLHTAGPTQIYTFPDTAALSQGLDKYVAKLSAEAIHRHGKFTVALSGGSLPKQLSAVLKHNKSVDFVSTTRTPIFVEIAVKRVVSSQSLDLGPFPLEKAYLARCVRLVWRHVCFLLLFVLARISF